MIELEYSKLPICLISAIVFIYSFIRFEFICKFELNVPSDSTRRLIYLCSKAAIGKLYFELDSAESRSRLSIQLSKQQPSNPTYPNKLYPIHVSRTGAILLLVQFAAANSWLLIPILAGKICCKLRVILIFNLWLYISTAICANIAGLFAVSVYFGVLANLLPVYWLFVTWFVISDRLHQLVSVVHHPGPDSSVVSSVPFADLSNRIDLVFEFAVFVFVCHFIYSFVLIYFEFILYLRFDAEFDLICNYLFADLKLLCDLDKFRFEPYI